MGVLVSRSGTLRKTTLPEQQSPRDKPKRRSSETVASVARSTSMTIQPRVPRSNTVGANSVARRLLMARRSKQ